MPGHRVKNFAYIGPYEVNTITYIIVGSEKKLSGFCKVRVETEKQSRLLRYFPLS